MDKLGTCPNFHLTLFQSSLNVAGLLLASGNSTTEKEEEKREKEKNRKGGDRCGLVVPISTEHFNNSQPCSHFSYCSVYPPTTKQSNITQNSKID